MPTIKWGPSSSQELLPELFVCGVARNGEDRKNIDCSEEDARCYVETIKHEFGLGGRHALAVFVHHLCLINLQILLKRLQRSMPTDVLDLP